MDNDNKNNKGDVLRRKSTIRASIKRRSVVILAFGAKQYVNNKNPYAMDYY
jgi:hypothetical protein